MKIPTTTECRRSKRKPGARLRPWRRCATVGAGPDHDRASRQRQVTSFSTTTVLRRPRCSVLAMGPTVSSRRHAAGTNGDRARARRRCDSSCCSEAPVWALDGARMVCPVLAASGLMVLKHCSVEDGDLKCRDGRKRKSKAAAKSCARRASHGNFGLSSTPFCLAIMVSPTLRRTTL